MTGRKKDYQGKEKKKVFSSAFGHGGLHFQFALGPTNDIVGPDNLVQYFSTSALDIFGQIIICCELLSSEL